MCVWLYNSLCVWEALGIFTINSYQIYNYPLNGPPYTLVNMIAIYLTSTIQLYTTVHLVFLSYGYTPGSIQDLMSIVYFLLFT